MKVDAALLRSRDFRLLLAGQAVSRLGDGLLASTLAFSAWLATHSPSAVAAVTVAAHLPAFAGTLVGASLADRRDRRRLMIVLDLARAAVVAPVALLSANGLLDVTALVVVAALVSGIGAPFAPARNAIVPQVVERERLLAANGLLQGSFRAAFFVGPLLLLPIERLLSLHAVYAIDAASFLVSAATLARLRVPPSPRPAARTGLRADLAEGWAVLRGLPDVRLVIGTFAGALLVASGFLTVGLATLVGSGAHPGNGSAGVYGALLGVAGCFEVVGAVLLTGLRVRNLAVTATLAWVLLGAFRLPLGFAEWLPAAAALLAVTGMASALTDVPLISLVQQRVPERHLAKALGLWEAAIAGAVAVSPLMAAAVVEAVGVRAAFAVSSLALMAIGALAALRVRSLTPPAAVTTPALAIQEVPR